MESKSKTFTEINEQVLMRFILEKGFFGDFLCPRILAHEECCHGHATATGFWLRIFSKIKPFNKIAFEWLSLYYVCSDVIDNDPP